MISGTVAVPTFNRDKLSASLRTDQDCKSTFAEFLEGCWRSGVIRYDVDVTARRVSYYGCNGEAYVEEYPAVSAA